MKLLLVDNQLPIALSRFLSAQGFESVHVMDVGLDETGDREIWDYATLHDYTIVSKDEDFLHLSYAFPTGPQFIWVRLGNCRKVVLLETFLNVLPLLREALESGQKVIEIRYIGLTHFKIKVD